MKYFLIFFIFQCLIDASKVQSTWENGLQIRPYNLHFCAFGLFYLIIEDIPYQDLLGCVTEEPNTCGGWFVQTEGGLF